MPTASFTRDRQTQGVQTVDLWGFLYHRDGAGSPAV